MPSMTRPGRALAMAVIVGAMSMLATSCSRVVFWGTPGPRMIIGTRSPSS